MVELLDQEPITRIKARIWAESLSRDASAGQGLAIAAALEQANIAAYRSCWPLSAANARLLREALLGIVYRRRHWLPCPGQNL